MFVTTYTLRPYHCNRNGCYFIIIAYFSLASSKIRFRLDTNPFYDVTRLFSLYAILLCITIHAISELYNIYNTHYVIIIHYYLFGSDLLGYVYTILVYHLQYIIPTIILYYIIYSICTRYICYQ